MEGVPNVIHWRSVSERPPGVEWVCTPNVNRWESARPDFWKEPPMDGGFPGIEIAPAVQASTLTRDEARAIARIVACDMFWQTDGDLPMVYGLPTARRDLAALLPS